jgi:hypothetical protein
MQEYSFWLSASTRRKEGDNVHNLIKEEELHDK